MADDEPILVHCPAELEALRLGHGSSQLVAVDLGLDILLLRLHEREGEVGLRDEVADRPRPPDPRTERDHVER